MINFAFIKSQFKIIKNLIIIFFIILFIWTIPSLTQQYFINEKGDFGLSGSLFFNFFFFIPSFILLFIFSLISVNKLLLKEVNKGYFSSWLSTPMSRKTTLNSKFFVILSSILFLNFSILLIQLILFYSIFKDFNSQMSLSLFLYFLSLIFVSILFTSIAWIISCYFCDKQWLSISLISGLLVIFLFFYVLSNFVKIIPGLENLKYLRYLTITSFLKPISLDKEINMNFDFGSINFIWQIPIELILINVLFISGNLFFCKKDLHL